MGSEKTIFETVRNRRSRSSKVVDYVTNRKCVCDFLFVINSKLGALSHRFRDTATYWPKTPIFPTSISFNTLAQECPFRIFA